jgi:Methyltransferase domain
MEMEMEMEKSMLIPARTQSDALAELSAHFPWPVTKPELSAVASNRLGWGLPENLLRSNINEQTRVIVELGTWLGESARFFLEHALRATVICIDHWKGSAEHERDNPEMLPTLYEDFLALNWDYRDRIIPIRKDTADGLKTLASYHVVPDLIYVDASHEFNDVQLDLDLIDMHFQSAIVIGDDYDWDGVRRAVNRYVYRNDLALQCCGRGWQILRKKNKTVSNHE